MIPKKKESQRYEALLRSISKVFEYSKPKSAGQKPGNSGNNKQRARPPEPEHFFFYEGFLS